LNPKPLHLYLHIPFCHQACHYCDFHFSTNLAQKKALVDAICTEIKLQNSYLPVKNLETIYFGGGTPSLLHPAELAKILTHIHREFSVDPQAEITLEANPEDLTVEYLEAIKALGINRLSIGIQSFQDKNLPFLHRNHSVSDSLLCIARAQEVGLSNISIDLIYGIPENTIHDLEKDLDTAIQTGVEHISAYSLTIEPKTVFGQQKKKGILKEIDEELMSDSFLYVRKRLTEVGFDDYETSNFAKNKRYSRHNTSYWNQEPYLGIGPSAHSFNGFSRQWNVAKNGLYIQSISEGHIPSEIEMLSPENKLNEYLMTRLRTAWGIDLETVKSGYVACQRTFPQSEIDHWIENGLAILEKNQLRLIGSGKLMADKLASDLFVV